MWGLKKSNEPIHGFAMLRGESPDLFNVSLRLPASLRSAIFDQLEHELALRLDPPPSRPK